ncbi:D-alanyl-D-alanine carboxypeptidase [Candidatus Kaiserbacteria bacterium]|nr:D-alanyl-D-alanine carboxypeptidase [Candidatus Kaiserbacteria bacterium]
MEESTTDNQNNDPITLPSQAEPQATSGIPVTPSLIILGVFMFILLGGALTPKVISYFSGQKNIESTPIINNETNTLKPFTKTEQDLAYSEVKVRAQSAYVWDIANQQVLYAKNEAEVLPIASITKLMTALVADEILAKDETVAIGTEATRQDSPLGLVAGQSYDRQSLTDLTLISSANDGAYALAASAGSLLSKENPAGAFVAAMNVRAEEIGLHQTVFKNPTGLDMSASEAGAVSSARDVAFLMEYILQNEPDILTFTQDEEARIYSNEGSYIDANNTNFYIDEIPGLLGSKTGYTDLAGGNLVVAYDAGLNRPIVVVALGSTQHERFTDVMKLIEATNNLISKE